MIDEMGEMIRDTVADYGAEVMAEGKKVILDKEAIEKIQDWVDNRFGLQNRFNTPLLIDFVEFLKQEFGYLKPPEGEPPLLSPEEINKAYDRTCNKWSEDGKTDVYEFNFLWQYIANEVAKAQRRLCKKHYEG